jgi:hypothetical protein
VRGKVFSAQTCAAKLKWDLPLQEREYPEQEQEYKNIKNRDIRNEQEHPEQEYSTELLLRY